MLEDEAFDPATGQATRTDNGIKRWIRGYKKKFFLNTFDMLYFFGALVTAGMGLWASILSMHKNFSEGNVTAFTCVNPAG